MPPFALRHSLFAIRQSEPRASRPERRPDSSSRKMALVMQLLARVERVSHLKPKQGLDGARVLPLLEPVEETVHEDPDEGVDQGGDRHLRPTPLHRLP